MRSTRRVISTAARREKVNSIIRRGSAPRTMRCATRCASVLVLPVPAPAMMRSGEGSPCSTAWRCSGLSLARYGAAVIWIEANRQSHQQARLLGVLQIPHETQAKFCAAFVHVEAFDTVRRQLLLATLFVREVGWA